MKKTIFLILLTILGISLFTGCGKVAKASSSSGDGGGGTPVASNILIDHSCTSLNQIPVAVINTAKANLHIAYGHTSHGSQLTDGMSGLASWKGSQYSFNNGGTGGALDLKEDMGNYSSTYGAYDLNNPSYTDWASATRTYLSTHASINVVMWSWCSGADTTEENINTYLSLMTQLEIDYPNIKFVYITGHLNGTGLTGNLHLRNEQIRKYCLDNNKILYDFEDIESYDPDGNYFGDKNVDDACNYTGGNWATAWQTSHTENADWYSCGSAHSEPLNANQKAYAAWWLWARLAGWAGK